MEKLKVGDEVYAAYRMRYNTEIAGYRFQKVVRLTKTRAVLESGIQIVNEVNMHGSDAFFIEYGNRTYWRLSTDNVREKSERFYRNKKISEWFLAKKFTDEEKELIYNIFNHK